jgi:hypothetical protein
MCQVGLVCCPALHRSKKHLGDFIWIPENICLPNTYDDPPGGAKKPIRRTIANDVICNLPRPILRVGSSLQFCAERSPITTMPKITVTKDDNSRSWKNDIRLARESPDVLAEPQSYTPECRP